MPDSNLRMVWSGKIIVDIKFVGNLLVTGKLHSVVRSYCLYQLFISQWPKGPYNLS